MKRILAIDLSGDTAPPDRAHVLGQLVEVLRAGCGGDSTRARSLIQEHDGKVDAIALDGIPATLQLGTEQEFHPFGEMLLAEARRSPIVDGSAIRSGLERWAVYRAEQAQPGLFAGKRTLLAPGLNHSGLAHALSLRTTRMRYADPAAFFGLPMLAGVGRPSSLRKVAAATLHRLRRAPVDRFAAGQASPDRRTDRLFRWAEVVAGDVRLIRALAPATLRRRVVVVEAADDEDVEDLRRREVSILVTLMPSLDPESAFGRFSASVVEAVLAAVRPLHQPLNEDTYLDMVSDLEWTPAVRFLQPGDEAVNRFAFVIHPLDVRFIHRNPLFRWTRYLPDALVEPLAARLPPLKLTQITGARSPTSGQRVEGRLFALGATPRQMLRRHPRFTYRRLGLAARMAARDGARLIGLGAFTSVIGDAGVTVARESPIAVTSGNSLTVAATLEAAKQAATRMGLEDLSAGRAMVIGATGSIGSVCARMLAQAVRDVVLVSIEPDRLIELKRQIYQETPGARITVATRASSLVRECDVIVTATSAFGQRILDISQCKPGAIVCDVARPPDINEEEASLRPDVLVIESGEVLIPGEVEFHYDIGLPPKVAYACLAETALLAMEGRFESYTLGRQLSVERVKEIYGLFKKHGFQLAGLRSIGRYLTDADLSEKRELAERLRSDPEHFERLREEAARKIAELPVRSKGVAAASAGRRSGNGRGVGSRLADLTLRFARGRTES